MKKIYSLWLQGYDNAPDQVKICLDRWCKLNPSYSFQLLDSLDVQKLLKKLPLEISNISQQSLSDIVRLALLQQNGGIWVDATVFPIKKLSEWAEETFMDADFFSYRRETQPGISTDRPISAWFMYASKESIIIEKLWKETLRYWSFRHIEISDSDTIEYLADPISFMGLSEVNPSSPYPYHWFQHIFAYLLQNDVTFSKIWDSCPYKSLSSPHQIQYWVLEDLMRKSITNILTETKIKQIIENSEMQKLNWRYKFPIEIMEKYSTTIPYVHGNNRVN